MAKPQGRVRRYLKRFFRIAYLSIIALGVGLLILQSSPVEKEIGERLEVFLSEKLNREVSFRRFSFRLFSLDFRFKDVVLGGATPESQNVATVERVELDLHWAGLWSRDIRVNTLRIQGLGLHLEIDEEGRHNLPSWVSSGAEKKPTTVQVEHLVLEDSFVSFAEKRLPLDFLAEDCRAELSGSNEQVRGQFSTRGVELRLPGAPQPITLALDSRLSLQPEGLVIESLDVLDAGLELNGSGVVQWSPEATVQWSTHVSLAGGWLDEVGWLKGQVEGEWQGQLTFEAKSGQWQLHGEGASALLKVLGQPLAHPSFQLALNREAFTVDVAEATYRGGEVSARLHRPRGEDLTTDIYFGGVELGKVIQGLKAGVEGYEAMVDGEFRWVYPGGDQEHSGEGTLRFGPTTRKGRSGAINLVGELYLAMNSEGLRIHESRLKSREHGVNLELIFPWQGEKSLTFRVESKRIEALTGTVSAVPKDALWKQVKGQGLALGFVWWDENSWRTEFDLELEDATFHSLEAPEVKGQISLDPSGVRWMSLLAHRGDAELELEASIAAQPGKIYPTRYQVRAEEWPLEDLRTWTQVDAGGLLTAEVDLEDLGEGLLGSFRADVEKARWAEREIGTVVSSWSLRPESLALNDGQLSMPAGSLDVEGGWNFGEKKGRILLSGDQLSLAEEPLRSLGGHLSGRATVQAEFRGNLNEGLSLGRVDLHDLRVDDNPQAEDGVVSWDWRDGQAEFALRLPGVDIGAQGSLSSQGSNLEGEVELTDLGALGSWVAPPSPWKDLKGTLSGLFEFESGPSGQDPLLAFESSEVDLRLAGKKWTSLEPIRWDWQGDRIDVKSLWLGSKSDDEIFIGGEIPIRGDSMLDLHIQASLDARLLETFLPARKVAGRFEALLGVRGSLSEPEVRGQGRIQKGTILLEAFPRTLNEVEAIILLDPGVLVLDRIQGQLGGGEIQAAGRVVFANSESSLGLRMQISGRDIALNMGQGIALRGDGDLVFATAEPGYRLEGLVTLDRVNYLRNLETNAAKILWDYLQRSRLEAGMVENEKDRVALDVAVETQERALRVRNNLADFFGNAELTLKGTARSPVVLGRIETIPGGQLKYADNSYEIERALVHLDNSRLIEPVVDILATTEVGGYSVTMMVSGPLDRLDVEFISDPPLTDTEVLSLLTGGSLESWEGGNRTESGAEGLVLRQASSIVSKRFATLFGLDSLAIEPLSEGGTLSSARIRVGKQISKDLRVNYSYDPTDADEDRLELEWQVNKEIVIILTQGEDDRFTFDARLEHRF